MNNENIQNVENTAQVKEVEAVAQIEEKKEKPKRKRSIISIVLTIISFLLFIYVAFQTVIAFLNFNMVRQDQEPTYFVTKSTDKDANYDYTIYDMGLYKIVRKEDEKRYEIKLLPFFLEP